MAQNTLKRDIEHIDDSLEFELDDLDEAVERVDRERPNRADTRADLVSALGHIRIAHK